MEVLQPAAAFNEGGSKLSLSTGATERSLLQQYGNIFLGAVSLPDHELLSGTYCGASTGGLGGILQYIIDLLHQPDWGGLDGNLAAHVLRGALVDGYVCSGDPRWLAALAFLHRRLGDAIGEQTLLQAAQQQDPSAFPAALPAVYNRLLSPIP